MSLSMLSMVSESKKHKKRRNLLWPRTRLNIKGPIILFVYLMSAFTRNLAIGALLAGAYISNPDERSFLGFIEDEQKKEGATWLERKVISHLTSNMYERKDFYLFSVVRMPTDNLSFFGAFGKWVKVPCSIKMPTQRPPPPPSSSTTSSSNK